MKKEIEKIMFVFCVAFLASAMPVQKANAQPGVSISFGVFYDDLSPYGQWIDDPSYGYVWTPSVGAGFSPYSSGGHWAMTEYGNMWVSDYRWGWAPFHYGRWTHDSYYGWVWIPDTEWGPAWVTWRSNSSYYGWAPMGPNVTLSMSFGNYEPPIDWWVFIAPVYLYQSNWNNYYSGPRGNTTIIQNTTIINNTYVNNQRTYVAGPRAEDVQRMTHKDVTVYKVRNDDKPGKVAIQNNEVKVYRPAVERSGREEAPLQVKKAERPIGKPTPMNGGDKAQPNQKQNESPASRPEKNNRQAQPSQQRERQPVKQPKQRIEKQGKNPTRSSPQIDKQQNQRQREHAAPPQQQRERQMNPEKSKHEQPSREQPNREITPTPERKENQNTRQQRQVPAPQKEPKSPANNNQQQETRPGKQDGEKAPEINQGKKDPNEAGRPK